VRRAGLAGLLALAVAAAAGPVQRGSYGQSQIHALEFHARRRR
jgi:hypothetical protein